MTPLKWLDLGGGQTVSCGRDSLGLWLALEREAEETQELKLPPFEGGFGGMELVASPDQRFIAMHIYSGQSSQGYELFRIAPTLEHLGGLKEVYGHGDAPSFSHDAQWLASFMDDVVRVRDTGEYFEEVQDEYSEDRIVINWAHLRLQRVGETQVYCIDVGVEIPRSADIDDVHEWLPYDVLHFDRVEDKNVVLLRMPWKETLTLPLPPASAVVTSYGYPE